jgi:hypothetical protein
MKELTELQKEFINLLDIRFGIEPIQIDMDEIPEFDSLFQIEEKLGEIKEEYNFRDSSEEIN